MTLHCERGEEAGDFIDRLQARIHELEAALAGKDRIIERHVRWRDKAMRFLGTCPLTPEIREFIDSSTARMVEATLERSGGHD